jgi:tetratricopeptide (TPR) repeat protein
MSELDAPKLTANELQARAQKLLAADHFIALGITRAATPEEVKKAFIDAVKTWHPDRVPPGLESLRPLVAKVFARLELARNVLSDPARKVKYVEELAKPVSAADRTAAEGTLEFKKAEALLKKNDLAQAEQHLRRAIQLAPNHVDSQALLLSIRAKPTSSIQELKDLVAELDQLVKRDDRCARAYFTRGQLRKRLEMVREAHADFTKAAELDPKNIDAAREVRIFNMRQERDGGPRPSKTEKSETPGAKKSDADEGVGGFFRKLFKR